MCAGVCVCVAAFAVVVGCWLLWLWLWLLLLLLLRINLNKISIGFLTFFGPTDPVLNKLHKSRHILSCGKQRRIPMHVNACMECL